MNIIRHGLFLCFHLSLEIFLLLFFPCVCSFSCNYHHHQLLPRECELPKVPLTPITSQNYFHLKSKRLGSPEILQKKRILKSYHVLETFFKDYNFLKWFDDASLKSFISRSYTNISEDVLP